MQKSRLVNKGSHKNKGTLKPGNVWEIWEIWAFQMLENTFLKNSKKSKGLCGK
jgi:hypothetical protein